MLELLSFDPMNWNVADLSLVYVGECFSHFLDLKETYLGGPPYDVEWDLLLRTSFQHVICILHTLKCMQKIERFLSLYSILEKKPINFC